MGQLSKTGITDGSKLLSGHVTQSIDALTGAKAYDITISGSLNLTGSSTVTGSFAGVGTGLTGYATNFSASYALTSSHALTGVSSSYATTASNSQTASLALTGNGVFSGSFSGSHTGIILTVVSQSLNFVDDSAASTGGVALGGLYRSGSFIKIRIS